uniref:Ig-like domain-containing protein n=1 Tax=Poecilia mexicana TaxID=48701 RepID=A0A3B3XIC4_9TELE
MLSSGTNTQQAARSSHLILCPLTGSSPSDKIVQIPADMFRNPGETAKISCSHSIPDYDRIFWYKQSEHHEMKLLGYMLGDDGYPEKELNVKIDGSANRDKNSTLTVAELSQDSSAIYYC